MQAAGLSQAELARRVGVSQPTIYKAINNGKRGSAYLHKIAAELQTTPAYLMGDADDPALDAPAPTLSSEERAVIELYNCLESSGKKAVVEIMRTMAQVTLAGQAAVQPSKSAAVATPMSKAKPKAVQRETLR